MVDIIIGADPGRVHAIEATLGSGMEYVTRCAECRHWCGDVGLNRVTFCKKTMREMGESDYCSKGETNGC